MTGRVAAEATVDTNEHSGHTGISHPHETVGHSVSQQVNGMAHTNDIEGFCGLMKRGNHATFHHLSAKHFQRYVNEFATRHNCRQRDTEAIMGQTVVRIVGERLTDAAQTPHALPGTVVEPDGAEP